MTKAYQYDASGYFVEAVEDYGLLPNNATRTAPKPQDGYIPRWNGNQWEQIEDHKGQEGYVDGKPFTIKEYGPLPDGFNKFPPPPTLEEARAAAIDRIKEKRLSVEYAGPLVPVEGKPVRFPSEVKDETRLNSLAGIFMADPAAQISDWKVADGVYVTMTAPLLQSVKTAGFMHIAATFSVERHKREELEALDTA